MADRPIIFSGPMVQALLAGRKSQTRRVLKPQPDTTSDPSGLGEWGAVNRYDYWRPAAEIRPYQVGDRLWVRENCATWGDHEAIYRADDAVEYGLAVSDGKFGAKWKARPSIHMPRWASRLTLTVSDVRVQRLQDISAKDSIAEGAHCRTCEAMDQSACHGRGCFASIDAYRCLWNSLHGPGAWDANPWVVALTFDVVRQNIDQLPGVAG